MFQDHKAKKSLGYIHLIGGKVTEISNKVLEVTDMVRTIFSLLLFSLYLLCIFLVLSMSLIYRELVVHVLIRSTSHN